MVDSYYTIRLERMYGIGPSGVWHQVRTGEKARSLIIISCHSSIVSSYAPASPGDPPMAVNPKPTDAHCPLRLCRIWETRYTTASYRSWVSPSLSQSTSAGRQLSSNHMLSIWIILSVPQEYQRSQKRGLALTELWAFTRIKRQFLFCKVYVIEALKVL